MKRLAVAELRRYVRKGYWPVSLPGEKAHYAGRFIVPAGCLELAGYERGSLRYFLSPATPHAIRLAEAYRAGLVDPLKDTGLEEGGRL